MMQDHLDDATRSRLANFVRKQGGGKITLYAVSDRQSSICILVVSTCAEEALKAIREQVGLTDWTLATTNTRVIQRNVDAEPEVVAAFKVAHPDNRRHGSAPLHHQSADVEHLRPSDTQGESA